MVTLHGVRKRTKKLYQSTAQVYQTTNSMMRLMPDFIMIGVARGGTTSFYNYLIEHPGIGSAAKKEVHYFDYHFHKGTAWYRGHFPYSLRKYYAENIRKSDFITGEASPYYMYHPYVPERIAKVLPNVKLLVLLRNPIERAFSHYSWEVSWGNETLSFEEAIDCEEERIQKDFPRLANHYAHNHQHFSYISRGLYAEQLEAWFKFFPKEQFLIQKSEDMYTEPAATYKQALEFLGVPYIVPEKLAKEYKQYNQPKQAGSKKTKLNPATRERLTEYYKPHNERLYALLGRDFGW
ncbi:MAG TPA: sulfotransferase [Ktedonobacteraceae bacterium]|nr:sulfotransferase [Ktedonobacteraceae bacterium]